MTTTRIIIETTCSHGEYRPHLIDVEADRGCPGSTHRVLTEGQYVLIEKVDGEWPDWLADVLGDVVHTALGGLRHEPSRCAAIAIGVLGALAASAEDALSDHTEGTP